MHKEAIGTTEFTFKLADSEKSLADIFRLRYQVYCKECGFIKERDYPDKLEKDKYDDYSLHFLAEDSQGIVGTSRLILDNPYGLPIENRCGDSLIFDIKSIARDKFAEISRLAISRRYRKRKDDGLYYSKDHKDSQNRESMDFIRRIRPMAFGLYREMYQECKRRNITHWFALMERTLWLLLRMHNFVFQPIGDEIDFYGLVKPYISNIKELEWVVSRKSPQFMEYFLDGLEPEYRPSLSKTGGFNIDVTDNIFNP